MKISKDWNISNISEFVLPKRLRNMMNRLLKPPSIGFMQRTSIAQSAIIFEIKRFADMKICIARKDRSLKRKTIIMCDEWTAAGSSSHPEFWRSSGSNISNSSLVLLKRSLYWGCWYQPESKTPTNALKKINVTLSQLNADRCSRPNIRLYSQIEVVLFRFIFTEYYSGWVMNWRSIRHESTVHPATKLADWESLRGAQWDTYYALHSKHTKGHQGW